jgi:hypothetical protein
VLVRVKYWEIIADNLSKAGWSWGCLSAIDSNGRTIWIADAHRDDGRRFVVRADEKLTAFLELEIGDLRFRKILNVAQAAPIQSWNRKLMSSPERFKASRGCAGIALGLVASR